MNITFYIFLILLAFGGLFLSFSASPEIALYVFVVFTAFSGFLLAFYIFYTKRFNKKLTCPVGSNCSSVIYSEYAKLLGVPIEFGGMAYYAVIFGVYITLLFLTNLPIWVILGAMGLTSAAALFSAYLIFIQAFVLKQWCCWCVLSALFCAIIFIVSLGNFQIALSFLEGMQSYLAALYLLGISVGLGGITAVTVLFFSFLKDFRISPFEAAVLKTVSQIVWIALAILILSGVALYLLQIKNIDTSLLFLLKIFALLAIVVSLVIKNFIIAPHLIAVSFVHKDDIEKRALRPLRRRIFLWSAVSMAAWYFIFILDVIAI